MRLIDADKLIEVLHESLEGDCDLREDYEFMGIDEFIKNQPTAYDVDKVVEQLEEKELNCLKKDVITSNKRYRHMAYAFRQAIGVVKGGGE